MIDITEFISLLMKLVFSGLSILVGWAVKQYLIPWLKTKFTSNQLDTTKAFIKQMIAAAEQLDANGYFDGAKNKAEVKKEYVLNAVLDQIAKWGFTFNKQTISDLIESLIAPTKYGEAIAKTE